MRRFPSLLWGWFEDQYIWTLESVRLWNTLRSAVFVLWGLGRVTSSSHRLNDLLRVFVNAPLSLMNRWSADVCSWRRSRNSQFTLTWSFQRLEERLTLASRSDVDKPEAQHYVNVYLEQKPAVLTTFPLEMTVTLHMSRSCLVLVRTLAAVFRTICSLLIKRASTQ